MVSLPNLDGLAKGAQVVAVAVGAGWVVMNYIRNRTHVRRLELYLNASVERKRNGYYTLVSIGVKNPGLAIVKIRREDADLLVSTLRVFSETGSSKWDSPSIFDVFNWDISGKPKEPELLAIEPGLTITHQQLILLPDLAPDQQDIILLLELRIATHGRKWSATKVVMSSEPSPSTKESIHESVHRR